LIQDGLAELARLLHHRRFFDCRLHIDLISPSRAASLPVCASPTIQHKRQKNANNAFLKAPQLATVCAITVS